MPLALRSARTRSLSPCIDPLPLISAQPIRGRHTRKGGLRSTDVETENTMERPHLPRSEEHTSERDSLMRISYAVLCLIQEKRKNAKNRAPHANASPKDRQRTRLKS